MPRKVKEEVMQVDAEQPEENEATEEVKEEATAAPEEATAVK